MNSELSSAYFSHLVMDKDTIGYGSNKIPKSSYESVLETPSNHLNLVDYLKDLATIDLDRSVVQSDLVTNLGLRAFALLQQGVTFDTKADCCEESEPRLIRALDKSAILNPELRNPIVVTAQNQPVGVVKLFGERTLYGLEDAPEFGIYKGLFHSATGLLPIINTLPATSTAWSKKLDTPQGRASVIIQPLRMSTFCVPQKQRKSLDKLSYTARGLTVEDMNAPQNYDHDGITKLVTTANDGANEL